MRFRGYGVEAVWEDDRLRAKGTTPQGRAELGLDEGWLEVAGTDIRSVRLRQAPRGIGGQLLVVESSGRELRLAYRRDAAEQVAAMHDAIRSRLAEQGIAPEDHGEDEVREVVDLREALGVGRAPEGAR